MKNLLIATLYCIIGILNANCQELSKKEFKQLKKEFDKEGSREFVYNTKGELLMLKATKKPLCYNEFSFLTKEEIRKNNSGSLINISSNSLAVEVVPIKAMKIGKEWDMEIIGNYRLFKPGASLRDTTFLWASYHYKDGVREGSAEIWEESGKTGLMLWMRLNYKNDLLDGVSEMYTSTGNLEVSAEFKKGYVVGEVISYYNLGKKPFVPNFHINAWVHSGGILMPYQIGEYQSVQSLMNTIREKGGTLSEATTSALYTHVTYRLDSMETNGVWRKGSVPTKDFYQFLNGKPLVKYFVKKEKPWKPSEIYFFDELGSIVYSLSNAKGELLQAARKIEAEKTKEAMEYIKNNYNNRSGASSSQMSQSVFFIEKGELKERRPDPIGHTTSTFSGLGDGTILGFAQGIYDRENVVVYWTNSGKAFICDLSKSGGWSSKKDLRCRCIGRAAGDDVRYTTEISNITFAGENTMIISCVDGNVYKKTPSSESSY